MGLFNREKPLDVKQALEKQKQEKEEELPLRCPLIQGDCILKKCALYDVNNDDCCIQSIADNIRDY